MQQDWMIDVLSDLRRVARENGLGATEAALEDACLVAMAEIASAGGTTQTGPFSHHEGKIRKPRLIRPGSDVA